MSLKKRGIFSDSRTGSAASAGGGISILPVIKKTAGRSGTNRFDQILKAFAGIEPWDEEQKRELASEIGIVAERTIRMADKDLLKPHNNFSKNLNELTKKGRFVVSLLDEPYFALEPVSFFSQKFSGLHLLYLGAHSALRDVGKSNIANSGNYIAKLASLPIKITELGIRYQSLEEYSNRMKRRVSTIYAREIKLGMLGDNWQEIITASLSQNIYLHINLNCFDPSLFPDSFMPEPGGFLWDELLNLVKIIGLDKNIVSFDISGFGRRTSNSNSSFFAAKLIYKLLNYAFINKEGF